MPTKSNAKTRYEVILKNRNLAPSEIHKMIPELSEKSITVYQSYVKKLDNCKQKVKSCPSSLYDLWLEQETDPNNAGTSEDRSRKYYSYNDYQILIDNYKTKSSKQISSLLPHMHLRTLQNYTKVLKNLDKGLNTSKSLPEEMYQLWKKTNESINCNETESTKKDALFTVIQNDKVIYESNDKRDAESFKQSLINSIKIYQLVI